MSALLREAIQKAKDAVAAEVKRAGVQSAARRLQALQLIDYKLERLAWHGSRRLLNDLRMLRRLLLGERERAAEQEQPQIEREMQKE
jgi:hypothetical protein